jgi:hypothetical protein
MCRRFRGRRCTASGPRERSNPLGVDQQAVLASAGRDDQRLDGCGLEIEGFGPTAQTVTAALEGALFAACVIGGIIFAHRMLRGGR